MCQNVVLVVWDSSTVTMAEMWVSFVKVYVYDRYHMICNLASWWSSENRP